MPRPRPPPPPSSPSLSATSWTDVCIRISSCPPRLVELPLRLCVRCLVSGLLCGLPFVCGCRRAADICREIKFHHIILRFDVCLRSYDSYDRKREIFHLIWAFSPSATHPSGLPSVFLCRIFNRIYCGVLKGASRYPPKSGLSCSKSCRQSRSRPSSMAPVFSPSARIMRTSMVFNSKTGKHLTKFCLFYHFTWHGWNLLSDCVHITVL